MWLASVPCYLWWFVAGAFAGWLLWWLIDRLFLRSDASAIRLSDAEQSAATAHTNLTQALGEIERQKKELAGNKARMSELAGRIDSSVALDADQEAAYKALLAERDQFKAQLDKRTDEVSRLTASEGQLHTAVEELKARLTDYETIQADTETAYTKAIGERDQLQSQLAASTEALNRLTSSGTSQHNEIINLKAQLEKFQINATGSASDAAARAGEIAKLEMQLAEARAGAQRAADETLKLRQEAAQLRQDLAAATDHTKTSGGLSDEIGRLRSLIATKDQSIAAAQTRINELDGMVRTQGVHGDEVARLKAELGTARSNGDRINKELHVAQEWLTRMGTDLETAKAAHQTSEDEIARLKGEIGLLNVQVNDYQKLRKALEAARQAAQMGLDIGKTS